MPSDPQIRPSSTHMLGTSPTNTINTVNITQKIMHEEIMAALRRIEALILEYRNATPPSDGDDRVTGP